MNHPVRIRLALAGCALFSVFAGPALASDDIRLAVVISVDQLRGDYLTRFDPYFEDGGFRRLTKQGAFFVNAYVSHGASETAPGHATISTGCEPRQHGITGNKWFLKPGVTKAQQPVEDPQEQIVGTDSPADGMSPRMLIGATVGDELKLADRRSRVFSIAAKDRAAIFMGGKSPDGVFWCDKRSGLMVTSTYYMAALPAYVSKYNEAGGMRRYGGRVWERLRGPEAYAGAYPVAPDWSKISTRLGPAFPHRIPDAPEKMDAAFSELVLGTPFGNECVLELAEALIAAEKLGRGPATDLLFLGLSANDYVGHYFGPESPEVLDMTLRTDRQLAAFFEYLEKSVGLSHCLLVLTADHGMSSVPRQAQQLKLDGGTVDLDELTTGLNHVLSDCLSRDIPDIPYGPLVLGVNLPWVFCDPQFDEWNGKLGGKLNAAAMDYLRHVPGVQDVYSSEELAGPPPAADDRDRWLAWRSYCPRRSGRFYLRLLPFWGKRDETDIANHDTGFVCDRHIPILFAGPRVQPGRKYSFADQTDIAVTLAAMLGIEAPPEAVGHVLEEAIDRAANP